MGTKQLLFIFLLLINSCFASSIVLCTHDAVVWYPQQTVRGELVDFKASEIRVHLNAEAFWVSVAPGGKFGFQLMLKDTKNKIWVEVPGSPKVVSDTLHYTLGYEPKPIVEPLITSQDSKITLHAHTLENPYREQLKYHWIPSEENPVTTSVMYATDSIATVVIPENPGIYYYDLWVKGENDSSLVKTYVVRDEKGLHPFDIDKDFPRWMDKAIVYQITPASFVKGGNFADITQKLPELNKLGINTIWLQPVFKTFYGGQGYDVIDYLELNPDLGTSGQMHDLLDTAEKLNIRVLFDLVLNHTSVHHPYALDRIKYGKDSHYYDYYQHVKDGKPYSSYYNINENGFISYFWKDLVNLNYQNEEVRRWILEVCKFWIKEYGIDGYRFDAIWGVNSRRPGFARQLRTELKSIKPDILLLAEAKGSEPAVYESGFDAAYDWTKDTTWVSQWSWEYEYEARKSHTIFNNPKVNNRGTLLRTALFHNGANDFRKLRFIENNDLPRFIKEHGKAKTEMAAALMFALPGIPMLYNGQEVGVTAHPYSGKAIFKRQTTIAALDSANLLSYYQKLIKLRKQYGGALESINFKEIPVLPEAAAVAFHRWGDKQDFIVVINMEEKPITATLNLQDIPLKYRQLKDVLNDQSFSIGKNNTSVKIPMEGYSVRWLLLKKRNAEGKIEKILRKK